MLKFDKVKIISSLRNIAQINEEKFQSIVKNGQLIEQKFSMQSPFLLYIEADYQEQELIIEFTGKILQDNYPQLINQTTIEQCLCNINQMGLCQLDIAAILADGEIVKADVCQDVDYPDCKALTNSLRAGISNFQKYLPRIICGNFVIEKNVQTKSRKRRLTIYDKAEELNKANNRAFLALLHDKQALLNYFEGMVRFEMNLNSKEQLRQTLHIASTTIEAVLGSTANPIWEFLDGAVEEEVADTKHTSLTELKNRLLLEHCGYDLAKVEALLRTYCSPNTHISQAMKPYRALAAKLTNRQSTSLKTQLRLLLFEVVLVLGFVSI